MFSETSQYDIFRADNIPLVACVKHTSWICMTAGKHSHCTWWSSSLHQPYPQICHSLPRWNKVFHWEQGPEAITTAEEQLSSQHSTLHYQFLSMSSGGWDILFPIHTNLDSNGDHQSDSEQTGKKILHYWIFEKKRTVRFIQEQ